jgi:dTDP-4-dehydrorhamnose 3,5-epimerase
MQIRGVQQIHLDLHEDDRGYLFEVVHGSDPFVPRFGQTYIVGNRTPHTVRAFHKHRELHDWFCIVNGSAKFVLVDDREDSPSYRNSVALVGTAKKPSLIVVPPGVYHGWMSLEDNTILCSIASHEYNRQNPDETRVPPDTFDEMLGGSPWRIVGR